MTTDNVAPSVSAWSWREQAAAAACSTSAASCSVTSSIDAAFVGYKGERRTLREGGAPF